MAAEFSPHRNRPDTPNPNSPGTFIMGAEITLTRPQNLKLYQPAPYNFDQQPSQPAKTPNEWFCQRYPIPFEKYGSPFLELVEPADNFTVQILPLSINIDFFAGVLGGRRDLGHHVIYFEPEMQWYFRDSDSIYKPTTAEKLGNLYRALMIKCAQDMLPNVHKLNLFHEWRSDHVVKAVVQRAKSILAADQSYFSSTSANQRIRGPELHERLMRVLCETMLQPCAESNLTMTQAYKYFCRLAELRQLGMIKRSQFKATMTNLMKDRFGVGLRRDLPNGLGKQQEAWKGIRLLESVVLAA
jgi:hypothetical protein